MSERLFIFVDESGDYANGSRYVVAGCWCVSNNNPRNILDNARAAVSRDIKTVCDFRSPPSELKGSKLPSHHIGTFLRSVEKYAYDDGTVCDPPYPWSQQSRPLAATIHDFDPTAGKSILKRYMSEVDAPGALQTLALLRVLNPLTTTVISERFDDIEVILDAEVWNKPAKQVKEAFDATGSTEISVETRSSEATPGIQIADLMAYSYRKHLIDGECRKAAEFTTELQI